MARISRTASTASGSDRISPSSASRRNSGQEVERMDGPPTSVGLRQPPENRPHLKSAWEPAVCTCGEPHHTFGGRPGGIAVGPDGAVFVSSPSSGRIWRIDARDVSGGVVLPGVAPVDEHGMTPRSPAGLAVDERGTLAVADSTGHRVWAIAPTGACTIVAGSTYGHRDGPAGEAQFRYPSDVAIGPDGTWYVADTGNHCIRAISPGGIVTTLAGSIYGHADGSGPDARFREPSSLDVGDDGSCYVADTGNNSVRRVTPDGVATTLAGMAPGGDADGTGAEVGLRWPTGIAASHDGGVWVADHGNGTLRRIDSHGRSTTVLRCAGRHWPVAVAVAAGGAVTAADVLDEELRPGTCLVALRAGR